MRPLPEPLSDAELNAQLAFDRQYPSAMTPGERVAVATAAAWREVARRLAGDLDVAARFSATDAINAAEGDAESLAAAARSACGPSRPGRAEHDTGETSSDPRGQESLTPPEDGATLETSTGPVGDAPSKGVSARGGAVPEGPVETTETTS